MIEALNRYHNRDHFDCGNPQLNEYFRHQAGQDIKRKLAAYFVLSFDNKNVLGFYTLSNVSISATLFPSNLQKKIPQSYVALPCTLIGRMAIEKKHQGKGLGKILLMNALKKSHEISKEIGSYAVIVDPIDQAAEAFYSKYDFIPLPDSKKMFLPMTTLQALFK
jgi:predicted GNAT family N-acyltransferase